MGRLVRVLSEFIGRQPPKPVDYDWFSESEVAGFDTVVRAWRMSVGNPPLQFVSRGLGEAAIQIGRRHRQGEIHEPTVDEDARPAAVQRAEIGLPYVGCVLFGARAFLEVVVVLVVGAKRRKLEDRVDVKVALLGDRLFPVLSTGPRRGTR